MSPKPSFDAATHWAKTKKQLKVRLVFASEAGGGWPHLAEEVGVGEVGVRGVLIVHVHVGDALEVRRVLQQPRDIGGRASIGNVRVYIRTDRD